MKRIKLTQEFLTGIFDNSEYFSNHPETHIYIYIYIDMSIVNVLPIEGRKLLKKNTQMLMH